MKARKPHRRQHRRIVEALEALEPRRLMDATPTNHPPTISLSSTEATAYVPFNPTVTFGDADGDPVSWAPFGWTPVGDTHLVLGYAYEANGDLRLIGTPSNADAGDNTYSVSLTDGKETVTQTFTVHVAAVADSPTVFITTPPTTATVGKKYQYDYELSDPDGRGENMNIHVIGSLPSWLHLTDDGYKASLLGTPSVAGDYTVSLGVDNETVTQSFTIHVAPNTPPAFTTAPATTATAESLYTYNIAAADPDGNPLSITAPTLPSWLTLTDKHNGTATLSGTPTNATSGTSGNAVALRVSDGLSSATQSFTLNVEAIDHPSQFSSTVPTAVTVGQQYTYNITAYDADRTDLMIRVLTIVPSWLKFTDHGDGTATLTGTPAAGNVGDFTVKLVCYDGSDTPPTQQFTIHVAPAPATNHPPTLGDEPTSPLVADALKPFVHTFTAGDQDADPLTITLENGPAWLTLVQNGDSATVSGTPDLTLMGTTTSFDLVISDGQESIRRTFQVTVPNFRYRLDSAGTLAVVGSSAADTIFVGLRDTSTLKLVQNGVIKNFSLASIKAIEVYTRDGNDVVTISSGSVPAYVLGGAGNDTLSGGDEVDNFVGGGGKDLLSGGLGDDRLNGHNGNDTIFGNDGDDRLYGGDGNDILVGGNGKDRCYGEAGDDFFSTRGDRKPDLLYGGEGNNTAVFDIGIDHLDDVLTA